MNGDIIIWKTREQAAKAICDFISIKIEEAKHERTNIN